LKSDGVPGGFGGVGAPGRGGPPEGAVGELVDRPVRVLLEPVVVAALRLLSVILTHMTIRDAIQLAEASRPPDGVIRCLIYVRISMDKAHDGHGVANQMAKLEHKARERGWTGWSTGCRITTSA